MQHEPIIPYSELDSVILVLSLCDKEEDKVSLSCVV